MNKKSILVTIDELGNITVSKSKDISYTDALHAIDYARIQLKLDSMQNTETNVATPHVYSY